MWSAGVYLCFTDHMGRPRFGSGRGQLNRTAEFVCLQFETQDEVLQPVAVLLLDRQRDRLYVRVRSDLDSIADPVDARALKLGLAQLAKDAETKSGSVILEDLESSLSNSVRMTERAPVEGEDLNAALEELYARFISPGV
jgi:hypothetical protein